MPDFLLFAGTQDGRELGIELLERGYSVLLSVATAYAIALQPEDEKLELRQGRLDRAGMEALILEERPRAVIDATHPYAEIVSAELQAACKHSSTPYLRLLRERSPLPVEARIVRTVEEAVAELKTIPGRIFLSTGSKEIAKYRELGVERLYPRVLPAAASLEACEAAGIPRSQIIAAQGPFSYEDNLRQIREFDIRVLVTKDGGETGGCPEKLAAASATGCEIVVIARPEESGYSAQEILAWAEKEPPR